MSFLFATALLLSAVATTPCSVIEYPGIELTYLPEYITPLIEGVVTEESGVLAGQPNEYGVSFSCHYWLSEEPVSDKNLWVMEKLSSVISPDLMESIHTSSPTWSEGSLLAEVDSRRSLGLMSHISFTFSPPDGSLGRGRAYGIFRNGYSVLLLMYGPSNMNLQNEIERVVGLAVLTAD